jgi:hypothetical protein
LLPTHASATEGASDATVWSLHTHIVRQAQLSAFELANAASDAEPGGGA